MKDITPRRFGVGDIVKRVDPHTRKPHDERLLVMSVEWLYDGWFCEVRPIVGSLVRKSGEKIPITLGWGGFLANEKFLVKA